MIFLVLSEKMIFIFPENIILFFRQKMKDDLSQKKIHGNMIFSSNILKRCSFQIKSHWNMIFLVLSERWYFVFTRKYDLFSLDGKWKVIFLKKYIEIWYFLYICINVTKMILHFCQKKSKTIFPRENTLKGDWHSRLTF